MKKLLFIIAFMLFFIENEYPSTLTNQYKKDTLKFNTVHKNIKINKKQLLYMNSEFESKGIWNIANRFGYIGKYQIGKLALLDMGYDSTWINELQSSIYMENGTYKFDLSLFPPEKQNEAIIKYLKRIENIYLNDIIKKYSNKKIDGIKITKAGILSASFLGFSNVRKFMLSNGKINPADGNGHTIKDRLSHFQNFEMI